MDKSAVLIGLCLGTLLIGLGIAIYQLWSADKSKQQGERSSLAARFGGKPVGGYRYPTDDVLTPDPRGQARGMHSVSDPSHETRDAAARPPREASRPDKVYPAPGSMQERITPVTGDGFDGSVQPANGAQL